MNLEEIAAGIEDMSIRGAGKIARHASMALKWAAENSPASDIEDFIKEMRAAEAKLLATRPTAISLHNGVKLTLNGMESATDVEEARRLVIKQSDGFVEKSNSAYARITELAPLLMDDPGKAITICHSTAAITAIEACHRAGKVTGAYSCETRPWHQGFITISDLAGRGVPVTLIVDSAMRSVMSDVAIAFVGADTVESDGSIVNKIGTDLLAATCRDFGVPVYTCAETYKFVPPSMCGQRVDIEVRDISEIMEGREVPPGVSVYNPVFSRVNPELITGIITEEGVISPHEASNFIESHLGDI